MRNLFLRVGAAFVILTCTHASAQTFQTLHTFTPNTSEGVRPWGTLTIGPDRNLYGTASEGGITGAGTAFRITPAGAFTFLGNFEASETGKNPRARLVSLGDFLYGASSLGAGGSGDPSGTVFRLDPAGGPGVAGGLTKMFAMPGGGITPKNPLALVAAELDALHVLGSSPGGIWRVPLDGGTSTVPFTFPTSGDDGLFPQSMRRGSDGYLYGVTTGTGAVGTTPGRRGTVFRVLPNGTDFSTLHDCLSETGVNPIGGLAEGPNNTFYGTTSGGGTHLDGVVFRITANGEYSVLHHVRDNNPTGDLLLASDGKLYGTSTAGGANLYGSVFRINTNGTGFQVIHTFNRTNGAYPQAGLVQADDGHLYGLTSEGGASNNGTIFRIDLNLPTPPQNRQPVAVNDQAFSSGLAVQVDVLANDFDPDAADTLTVTIESNPSEGTAEVVSGNQILYTPGAGYAGFDQFTYRITDSGGLFATATVTIADTQVPPPFQPGPYNGILNLDPNLEGDTLTPRGQLIINITDTGLFTGRLFAQGKRYPVVGSFDESGTAVAVVKLPKKKSAILFLAPGEGNSLLVVMFSQELWSGSLFPAVIPSPAEQASFTLGIDKDIGDLPDGGGYATMRLLPSGAVVAVGKMGDGSKLVWGTTLVSLDGTVGIPVYHAPVPGGACGGVFVGTGGSPTFVANLRWIRPPAKPTKPYPEGFSGQATGFLDVFVPPPAGVLPVDFGPSELGSLAFSGPFLPSGAITTFTPQGTSLLRGDGLRAFSINRKNGLFSGKVTFAVEPTPGVEKVVTVSFKGAFLQSMNRGLGYYTFKKKTGAVRAFTD